MLLPSYIVILLSHTRRSYSKDWIRTQPTKAKTHRSHPKTRRKDQNQASNTCYPPRNNHHHFSPIVISVKRYDYRTYQSSKVGQSCVKIEINLVIAKIVSKLSGQRSKVFWAGTYVQRPLLLRQRTDVFVATISQEPLCFTVKVRVQKNEGSTQKNDSSGVPRESKDDSSSHLIETIATHFFNEV